MTWAIDLAPPASRAVRSRRGRRRSATLTAVLLGAAVLPATAQLADSMAALNATGQWQSAIVLARSGLPALRDNRARCLAELQMLVAYDRLGRLDDGAGRLQVVERECPRPPGPSSDTLLARLKRDLTLPALPTEGLDFSGVDSFWNIVDTLAADREPSEAMWHGMWITPGYRFAFFNVQPLREDLELAFRPSRGAERARIIAANDDNAARLRHLMRADSLRPQLQRFRDSLARSTVLADAVSLAATYLPRGTTAGSTPPFVAFALFRDDAYSTGPRSVGVDLLRAEEGGLAHLLGHEFHHSYLRTIIRLQRVPDDSADALLVNSLLNLMAEGVADLIDKPDFLAHPPESLQSYAQRYLRERDSAPGTLRAIDAVLSRVPRDSPALRAAGRRVSSLLWSAGHPVGGYMARRINDTFGADSIAVSVYSPFLFIRMYNAAERAHGVTPPFSAATDTLLAWEERRYVRCDAVARCGGQ